MSRLSATDALDIPVNKPPGVQQGEQAALCRTSRGAFTLGSMKFTLIGPTEEELDEAAQGMEQLAAGQPGPKSRRSGRS